MRPMPWRDPVPLFHVLLAEILLQKTPAWKVEPAWRLIIKRWPTPQLLAAANPDELAEVVRPLGLIRRADTLLRLSAALATNHGGKVPTTNHHLKSLPGVGDYVASAVRCVGLGRRDVMLDSVTARVVKRYFSLQGAIDYPDAHTRRLARSLVPKNPADARLFNLALVDLAAMICRPVRPICSVCPLASDCDAAGTIYARGRWRRPNS